MALIRPIDSIESVIVTFSDTGESRTLDTRQGSSSHFFPRFVVGDDEIQLRLDWSELDADGQPTLDADFIGRQTGKHRALRGRRRDAHHTAASLGSARSYEWEFDGFSRHFSVTVSWRVSVSETLSFTSTFSAEVIRASDRKVKALTEGTKEIVRQALERSWSSKTSVCYNPEIAPLSYGQCAPTAAVVAETFGGEILKTQVPKRDGTSVRHFYNRIDGQRFDFTRSQFDDLPDYWGPVVYDDTASSLADAITDMLPGQLEAMRVAFRRALDEQNAG
jgi:hypothetical protein